LIELLIVVAVFFTLISLLSPALKKISFQANNAQCKGNLLSLAIAVNSYTYDFDETINMALERPAGSKLMKWHQLYTQLYIDDFELKCAEQEGTGVVTGSSYGWNYSGWKPGKWKGLGWSYEKRATHGDNAKLKDIEDPDNMFVLGDKRRNTWGYFGMGAFIGFDNSFPHFSHAHFDNVLYLDGHSDSVIWNLSYLREHRSSWSRAFDP